MKPDDTFRRAEGSGPWLHEPRKAKPDLRARWLIIWAIGFAVAALIGTVAIPAQEPFEPIEPFVNCYPEGC